MFKIGQNPLNILIDMTECLRINAIKLIVGSLMIFQVLINASMQIMKFNFALYELIIKMILKNDKFLN